MFCKSCNCNSSIATRVGFAVSPAYAHTVVPDTYASHPVDLLSELHVGMAHEVAAHLRATGEDESWVSEDAVRRR